MMTKEDALKMIRSDARVDGCVFRWEINGNVVPDEILADAGIAQDIRAENDKAREIELDKFFAELKTHRSTAEERAEIAFELRAAFGPGKRIVNVLTGKVVRS